MRSRWKTRASLAVAISVALLVSACGGTGSTDTTEATGTPTTEASQPGSTADSGAQGLDPHVQEVVDRATTAQTEWTGPTSSPTPMADVTIGILPCSSSVPGCQRQAEGAIEAAEELGWETVLIDGQNDVSTQQKAIDTFINSGVDGIIVTSTPAESICEQLKAADAAGIFSISLFGSDPSDCGSLGTILPDQIAVGEYCAAWILANGGGDIVAIGSRGNPQVHDRSLGFEAFLAEYGSGDTEVVASEYIPFSQVGDPQQAIMNGFLSRFPSGELSWIFAGFDAMMRPMIAAAASQGRTELQGCSSDGDSATLDDIRNGNIQSATVGFPLTWSGWAGIDALNRALNDEPLFELDQAAGITIKLLTKDNLPPEGQSYEGDVDFKSEYREIWGVSGG